MKKHLLLSLCLTCLFSCTTPDANIVIKDTPESADTIGVAAILDSLNARAARADFVGYFDLYADDGVFAGTDATELWNKKEFMEWSKPYFDKGKAWSFQSVQRSIHFGKHNDIAWFEELLDTQMKICRGSGVCVLQDGHWKVQQYILSITMPNDAIDSAIQLKTSQEDSLLQQYR